MKLFKNISTNRTKIVKTFLTLACLIALLAAVPLTFALALAGQVDANNVTPAPTIDGLLNEAGWNLATTASKTTIGSPNNTVTFGSMWDANYFYVGVKVLDASLKNDSANVWDDDAVEIMIDANHNKATTYDSYDRQYLKGYNDASLLAVGSGAGVIHASAAITGGYSVELAIPWSNLAVTPTSGMVMGLDVGYDDDDNGAARDAQAVWWGTVNDWGDTSVFGDVLLTGGSGPTATRTNTSVAPTVTLTRTKTATRTATRTNTPTIPTATLTVTNTPAGPTATRTNTPLVPTATNTPSGPTATSPGSTIFNETATNDGTNVYYSYAYSGSYTWYRVYIDTDENSATGFATTGIGADYLLEGPNLFIYSGAGGSWGWTLLKTVTFNNPTGSVNWAVARSDIGEAATPNSARILFQVEAPLTTSVAFTHYYSVNGTIVPTITLTPTITRTPTITPTPMPPTPTNPPGGSQTVNYTASTAVINNPERGTDHTNTDCQSNLYTAAQLQGYHDNDNMSIVLCNFYLDAFKTSPISQAALTTLQNQLNTIRTAGFKLILRFSYTKTDNVDADLPTVLGHINQLAPIIQANSDVIMLWQGSFIGEWGEAYYTSHYGNAGVISAQQWADRKAIYDAQLAALPTSRMISLRTPLMMTTMYGTQTVTSGTAFNGSAIARIGQHNDAFLASADDYGTYSDVATQYPWLQDQSTYTVMGGETNNPNAPRTDCPTAQQEMGMFHWSYINLDWYAAVIDSWKSQGCFPTIQQKLGYRFVLTQGTYPNHASAGGPLNIQLSIRNDGYAAPFNPRNREIILRNNATGVLYHFPLTSDPRLWLAGTTTNINQTLTLPSNIPNGDYALLLNLPDPVSGLSTRPEYSIQTANVGTWEAGTGFNNLLKTVTIP